MRWPLKGGWDAVAGFQDPPPAGFGGGQDPQGKVGPASPPGEERGGAGQGRGPKGARGALKTEGGEDDEAEVDPTSPFTPSVFLLSGPHGHHQIINECGLGSLIASGLTSVNAPDSQTAFAYHQKEVDHSDIALMDSGHGHHFSQGSQ